VEEISKGHSASRRVAGRVGVFSLARHHDGMQHDWVHMYTPRQRVNGSRDRNYAESSLGPP
jgi:hypothetical protein